MKAGVKRLAGDMGKYGRWGRQTKFRQGKGMWRVSGLVLADNCWIGGGKSGSVSNSIRLFYLDVL